MTIYLDHNATTPLDPRVAEAMLSVWREAYGNAASQAGATLDQGSAAARPYYDQARAEYAGLSFAPDQYGGTLQSGYQTLADATGANGAAGLARARALFTATPGYQEGPRVPTIT